MFIRSLSPSRALFCSREKRTKCEPSQEHLGEAAFNNIEAYRGEAIVSYCASACVTAAVDVLSQFEVWRALEGYGAFDVRSGLIVATAGRNAAVHAALLAAVERKTIRQIIVTDDGTGGKMAAALEAGVREQQEVRSAPQSSVNDAQVMSHAGVTAAESAEWSAALRGQDCAPMEIEDITADDADWAAIQAHFGGSVGKVNSEYVNIDVVSQSGLIDSIAAGEVHVILAGADYVDPLSKAAIISHGCHGVQALAEAAARRQPPVHVVVLAMAWGKESDAQGRLILPASLQSRVVGLPPSV